MTRGRILAPLVAVGCALASFGLSGEPPFLVQPQEPDAQHPPDETLPSPAETSKVAIDVRLVNLEVRLVAEGKSTLPSESKVELKGNDKLCKSLERPEQTAEDGKLTFPSLPVCKVALSISITGFDIKKVSLDLSLYKRPVRIFVKAVGAPVVTW